MIDTREYVIETTHNDDGELIGRVAVTNTPHGSVLRTHTLVEGDTSFPTTYWVEDTKVQNGVWWDPIINEWTFEAPANGPTKS